MLIPPAPPGIVAPLPPAPGNEVLVLRWMPSVASCSDGWVPFIAPPRPRPQAMRHWSPIEPAPVVRRIGLRFEIDAAGRPMHIGDQPPATPPGAGELAISQPDLAPALALARVAPGRPRKNCSLDFFARAVAVAAAPRALAQTVAATVLDEDQQRLVRPFVAPSGGSCYLDDGPRPITLRFPAPRSAGPIDDQWAVVTHDLGDDGRPRNVVVSASGGDRRFESAAIAAVSASRYARGPARSGCLAIFRPPRSPIVAAPPARAERDARRPDDTCPESFQPRLAGPLSRYYPPQFWSRRIEGSALIRFDVASWGEIGRIEVVDAQPSWAFGDAGHALLSGSAAPAGRPLVGCTAHILFKMPVAPTTAVGRLRTTRRAAWAAAPAVARGAVNH